MVVVICQARGRILMTFCDYCARNLDQRVHTQQCKQDSPLELSKGSRIIAKIVISLTSLPSVSLCHRWHIHKGATSNKRSERIGHHLSTQSLCPDEVWVVLWYTGGAQVNSAPSQTLDQLVARQDLVSYLRHRPTSCLIKCSKVRICAITKLKLDTLQST